MALGFPDGAIADYIDYYNNSRIQAKTKWMPPSKFREASLYGDILRISSVCMFWHH